MTAEPIPNRIPGGVMTQGFVKRPGYTHVVILTRYDTGDYSVKLASNTLWTQIETFSNPLAAERRAESLAQVMGPTCYLERSGFDD